MDRNDLTGRIIGRSLRVHSGLGFGFVEPVYQRALAFELSRGGLLVEREVRLEVRYCGLVVGEYVADLVVEGKVIVETKAVAKLTTAHERQLLNYLSATGIENGLLLNFGAPRLEVRRKYRTYRPKSESDR
jgi:GxxExxY protein